MKKLLLIIISIAAIGLFLIGMKPKINPLVSSFDKDGYVTFSGNGVNLLFDTGANITLLYTDTVPESFYPFVRTDAKDIGGNDFSVEKYFSFYARLGNIEGNLWTTILLPQRFQWQHIHGIIGTDMIDRCNWLIDFTKGEISNVHPFVPGTPDMVLFLLPKQDIEQMPGTYFLGKDTCYGFADAGSVIMVYEVAQGKVNKKPFESVTLATWASRRAIGISFFKRFSQVVLDTRRQKVQCYY